tara:strand:- start:398 stop:574 length:177 start_codon:yes stop_codon:yes gene_type:complete
VFGLENNNCANKQQYRLKKTKLQVKNNKTVDDQDYFQPPTSLVFDTGQFHEKNCRPNE